MTPYFHFFFITKVKHACSLSDKQKEDKKSLPLRDSHCECFDIGF